MAGSVNKVILVGNLGKDPEIRTTQDGREVGNLVLATSEVWKDKMSGERKEKTEWHRIVIFNEALVNISKSYLKKGSKIYLEGQLQTRKWTDSSGIERYTTEVVLQGYNAILTMLDRAPGSGDSHGDSGYGGGSYGGGSYGGGSRNNAPAPAAEVLDDDIPF